MVWLSGQSLPWAHSLSEEIRIVSPLEVAGLIEKAGFFVEESRLIEKETNVVCLRGRRDKHE